MTMQLVETQVTNGQGMLKAKAFIRQAMLAQPLKYFKAAAIWVMGP